MDKGILEMSIPKEDILDHLLDGRLSFLYYRIHKTYNSKRKGPTYISPSALKYSPKDKKMSTNWNKYCKDVQEARRLGATKPPEEYGLISLIVRDIRNNPELDKLEIDHDPKYDNPAHTNISGLTEYEDISEDAFQEVQIILSRMANWEISFENIIVSSSKKT